MDGMQTPCILADPLAFSAGQKAALEHLESLVWPPQPGIPGPEMDPIAERRARIAAIVSGPGGSILAHAELFTRTMACEGQAFEVSCLAGVCTHPDWRGRGLGALVVRQLFELIDKGERPAALWQTRVSAFYEKLGARLVQNRIVNSRHPEDRGKCPFWDPQHMIYPATARWPVGTIDLCGLGY
jgi:GNAT superfamily N-acetyltransferase